MVDSPLKPNFQVLDGQSENEDRSQSIFYALVVRGCAKEWFHYLIEDLPTAGRYTANGSPTPSSLTTSSATCLVNA